MMTKPRPCAAMYRSTLKAYFMQLDHWQLERSPFASGLDVDHFYPSPEHDEALARLEYLVDNRRRFGLLVGEAGVGKSLALRVAAQRLVRKGCAVVWVDATGIGPRDLLWQVAAGLGAAPPAGADFVRLWRDVSDRIVENRVQQTNTALLVDDAGVASSEVLAQLVRLARLEWSSAARWTIILAAEPIQAAHWSDTIRDMIDLRIDLSAWRREDTVGFVQTALVEAGRFDPVFDEAALNALHELAGGIPRRVARLADFALLIGAAAKVDEIDTSMVHEAFEELGWPTAVTVY
jgi:general secretion pathway protein A